MVRLNNSFTMIELLEERMPHPSNFLLDWAERVALPLEMGGENRNAIFIASGMPGSGKSEMLADLFEQIDPGFIQSFRDKMPRFTVDPWDFVEAIPQMVEQFKLDPYRPHCFQIDEPVGLRGKNWWNDVASAIHDHTDMMRKWKIFLGVAGPVMARMNPYLRDLCRFWLRVHSPGFALVKEFRPVTMNREPWEQMKPFRVGNVSCFGHRPSEELLGYMGQLKDSNFASVNGFWRNRHQEILAAKEAGQKLKGTVSYLG